MLLLLLPVVGFARQRGQWGTQEIIGCVSLQDLQAAVIRRLRHRASREEFDSLAMVALSFILFVSLFCWKLFFFASNELEKQKFMFDEKLTRCLFL